MPLTLKNFNPQPLPPLYFTANTANSTVQLTVGYGNPSSVSLETSTDKVNWSPYTIGNTITLSNIGDKVFFRNTSTTDTGFSIDTGKYYQFVMSGSIAGGGDINYLLNKNSTTTLSDYCYYKLFGNCTSLTSSPILPSTTLTEGCYYSMFNGCTGLETTPELPATILDTRCYCQMFQGCNGLTTVSALPATAMATYCYSFMFYQCNNLEALTNLPATTLSTGCYQGMFRECPKIKISSSRTGAYQTPYRIPTTGSGTTAEAAFTKMFYSTGGTYTSDPSINTTYYTSNTVV